MTQAEGQRERVVVDAGEREMLCGWLDYHRATLAMKCEGLTAEQLREQAVPPSTLCLLGLVRHMAEVERGWFRRSFAAEDLPSLYSTRDAPDADFDDVDNADAEEAFTQWREECDRARAIVHDAPSLDAHAAHPKRADFTLRWIVTHMIEEYARHNGHADLLRERIDGTTGE